jgi:Resolvase, N terminal domain
MVRRQELCCPHCKGDDWLHEPKWDGSRFLIIKNGHELKQRGIVVRFLDQLELNSKGKDADFLLTVLAAVAQLERDVMDEKRCDGIAAARPMASSSAGTGSLAPSCRPQPWR